MEQQDLSPLPNVERFDEHGWTVFDGLIRGSLLASSVLEARALGSLPSVASGPLEQGPAGDPWAGIRPWPTGRPALDRLPLHETIVALAERLVGTAPVRLLRADFQVKEAGAARYEQLLHYDREDSCLVAPSGTAGDRPVALFVFLSDINEENGPTAVVSRSLGGPPLPGQRELTRQEAPEMYAAEQLACGSAGSVLAFHTSNYHRATEVAEGRRLTLNLAYAPPRPWYGSRQAIRSRSPQAFDALLAGLSNREKRLLEDEPWEPWRSTVLSARHPDGWPPLRLVD